MGVARSTHTHTHAHVCAHISSIESRLRREELSSAQMPRCRPNRLNTLSAHKFTSLIEILIWILCQSFGIQPCLAAGPVTAAGGRRGACKDIQTGGSNNKQANKQAKVAAAAVARSAASQQAQPVRQHATFSSPHPPLPWRPLSLLSACLQSHWLSAFQFTRNANRLSFYVCLNIWHVRVAKPASVPPPLPTLTHQQSLATPAALTTAGKPATVTNPPRLWYSQPTDELFLPKVFAAALLRVI